jgi:CO/xanthine dehydrogenase FAD-binding subunit
MACLERRDEMPAFPEDIEQALLEKVKILPSWGPRRVLARRGAVTGMSLVRCTRVFDASGRFAPELDAKETTTVEADQVIVAIGQGADLAYASTAAVAIARNLVVVDPKTGATNLRGVFAAGDATSGPASVVEAIASGRRAAAAIDVHLGGAASSEADEPGTVLTPVNVAALQKSVRVAAAERELSIRTIDGEDKATIDLEAVAREALRCANCGCVAVNASDLAPALVALGATIRTNRRTISAERFFAARQLRSTVLEAGELVEAIEVPAPKPGTRQSFIKFRTRASIDFPILSVATVLAMRDDTISQARIVLGAVAPVPVRATAAEAALKGQEPKAAAARAGEAAIAAAHPLARNGFKVPIVAALVARSIVEAE